MVGIFQVAMYLINLGSLTTYLSDQLVNAFTTGAAMHVFTSQLKYLLGLKIKNFSGAFQIVFIYIELLKNITDTNIVALLISVICILTLIFSKQVLDPRVRPIIKMPVPAELVVVGFGTGLSYYLNLTEEHDVRVVGNIPSGVPPPTAPQLTLLTKVIGDAFSIAVVAFTVTVSMAKIFAKKHNYSIDTNQELFAQGAVNVVTSCFGGFACSASLSRSAVQENVGGKTQVVGIVSSIILLLVLLFLGPFFQSLPNAVLASIIVVALKGMFLQYKEVPSMWRLSKSAFLIWFVTWVSTVFIDVKFGLVIGVAFSLLTIVWHTQRPFIAIMGRVPGTNIYKATNVYQPVAEMPGIKIFRFESSLYFANAESFLERLYKLSGTVKRVKRSEQAEMMSIDELGSMTMVADYSEQENLTTKFVIIDCSMFGYIDLTGVSALIQAVTCFDHMGIEVLLSGCRFGVRKMLRKTNFYDKVPQDRLHLTIHDAVLYASSRIPGGALREEAFANGTSNNNHIV